MTKFLKREVNVQLHSWLTSKASVAPSELGGLGVLAAAPIASGELVCVWGGCVYTSRELEHLSVQYPQSRTHPFQVADDCFIGSTSLTAIDSAERFNHSWRRPPGLLLSHRITCVCVSESGHSPSE